MLKLLDEARFLVIFLAFCVIVYLRTAHVSYVVWGACMVALCAKCIKLLFRTQYRLADTLRGKDSGILSSHAAVMVYFTVYLDLTAAVASPLYGSLLASGVASPSANLVASASPGHQTGEEFHPHLQPAAVFPRAQPALLLLGVFMHCVVLSALRSRVTLYRNSVSMVVAGALLGGVGGALWFFGWHRYVWPIFVRAWKARDVYESWTACILRTGNLPEILRPETTVAGTPVNLFWR